MTAWLVVVSYVLLTTVVRCRRIDSPEQASLEDGFAVNEFCAGETFRPRCAGGKNDVVVMLTARYGRMSFGRCLVEEPEFAPMAKNTRFVGCYDDVKRILDQHCSGLSECDVRINDQNFEGIQPCLVGLKMHLEASYMCVKVTADSRHCTIAMTSEPQHIIGGSSSRSLSESSGGCGTESHPWSVEALAGQRIAVSLIDLESASSRSDETRKIGCHPLYGFIVDRNLRRNVSICMNQQVGQRRDNESTHTTTIHVSQSNQLQIVTKNDIVNKFLVRVEAVGCSDLAPPSDAAWLKRVDDQITVGCYMSRQSWQLNCVNGVWTGTVGVCSQALNDEITSQDDEQSQSIQKFKGQSSIELVALAAVSSAGIAVCCLVICIGVLCLRRQKKLSMTFKPRRCLEEDGVLPEKSLHQCS